MRESEDTAMVTIYNIDVVTDYMQQEEFLTPEGEVRPILLSEMGFTSTYGEDVQAAAFAYAYFIAENNPYIDAMILSRETDAAEEWRRDWLWGCLIRMGVKSISMMCLSISTRIRPKNIRNSQRIISASWIGLR